MHIKVDHYNFIPCGFTLFFLDGELNDKMSDCQVLKNDPAP
jgi:hypothetical protein